MTTERMKFGLVCISEILRDRDPSLKFKTMTRKFFLSKDRKLSLLELSSRILHNLKVVKQTLLFCREKKIAHYRMSSGMFPLITDESLDLCLELEVLPDFEAINEALFDIGRTALINNISLSIHPDQYVVLASLKDEVRRKSIAELNFQGSILDLIGAERSFMCPINIHPGSCNLEKDTPEQFVGRFFDSFLKCSSSVKSRLVLENEHSGFWNCKNLYFYFHKYSKERYGFSIPLTLDNLHDKCNPSFDVLGKTLSYNEWFLKFFHTWPCRPVFHWSEGKNDSFHHADNLTCTPKDLGLDIVYEVEVKNKDKGFLHLI